MADDIADYEGNVSFKGSVSSANIVRETNEHKGLVDRVDNSTRSTKRKSDQ